MLQNTPCYFERTENKNRLSKGREERAAGIESVCVLPVKSAAPVNRMESSVVRVSDVITEMLHQGIFTPAPILDRLG